MSVSVDVFRMEEYDVEVVQHLHEDGTVNFATIRLHSFPCGATLYFKSLEDITEFAKELMNEVEEVLKAKETVEE